MRFIKFFVLTAVLLIVSATAKAETFSAYLNAAQEVPTNASTATGFARVVVNESLGTFSYTVVFSGLLGAQTALHIHAPGVIGVNAGVAITLTPVVGGTSGTVTGTGVITPTQIAQLRAHQGYVNLHSMSFPGGEIRGQLGVRRPVDNDGDGRTDFSILRFPAGPPSPISYWNLNSTTGVQVSGVWGDAQTDFPTPGDFDGDGRDDLALYRDGTLANPQSVFLIFRSSDNTGSMTSFGLDNDVPVARDYDGDGRTDIATYRGGAAAGNQSFWFIRRSTTGTDQTVAWGTRGATGNDRDVPIPGDYDGDGRFDIAVYRIGTLMPSNTYIILRSSDSQAVFQPFGNFSVDYIVPGDYDGDGRFDYAVARIGFTPSAPMVWWILQSSNGQLRVQTFGITSDRPTQGDYDGDARTDIAIWRAGATAGSQSNFWVFNSLANTASVTPWGIREDFPVNTFDAR